MRVLSGIVFLPHLLIRLEHGAGACPQYSAQAIEHSYCQVGRSANWPMEALNTLCLASGV